MYASITNEESTASIFRRPVSASCTCTRVGLAGGATTASEPAAATATKASSRCDGAMVERVLDASQLAKWRGDYARGFTVKVRFFERDDGGSTVTSTRPTA